MCSSRLAATLLMRRLAAAPVLKFFASLEIALKICSRSQLNPSRLDALGNCGPGSARLYAARIGFGIAPGYADGSPGNGSFLAAGSPGLETRIRIVLCCALPFKFYWSFSIFFLSREIWVLGCYLIEYLDL